MVKKRNWDMVGRYTGKIVADVVGKNPLTTTWSYQNSESIPGQILTPSSKLDIKSKIMKLFVPDVAPTKF